MPFLILVVAAAISWTLNPALWGDFFQTLINLDERGHVNPTSLALFRDIADGIGVPALGEGLFLAFAAIGVATTVRTILRNRRKGLSQEDFLFYCFTAAALILPRFKDYSYMLLILPSLRAFLHPTVGPAARMAVFAAVCITAFPYQPLLAAAVIFSIYTWRILPSSGTLEPANN